MTTPTENVVAELRKPAPKFGLEEFDPTYDIRQIAAALIESQRATIERVEREAADKARIYDEQVTRAERQWQFWEERAVTAEARVTALEAALKPFAKAAEDCDVGDDIRIGVVKPADVIWESAAAASITFGHLNTAAQTLSRSTEKNDD